MKLYFEHSDGRLTEIGQCENSIEDADKKINEYIKKNFPHFKVYYTRCWEKDGFTYFDVGSWTEFFIMAPDDKAPKGFIHN